jgi:hypothetical protein
MEYDKKYSIGLSGEYHAGINDCPECDVYPSPLMAHCIGIAEAPIGTVFVIECPECYTHWYFHCRSTEENSLYTYFLRFIDYGMNVHYQKL